MLQSILLVEDEEPALAAMCEYFTANGYKVDCAREIDQAKRLFESHRHAIVLADLSLTGISNTEGFEIVSYVRERCSKTIVVLLTAQGSPDIEREAFQRQVDLFLRKPKSLPEVERLISHLTKMRST